MGMVPADCTSTRGDNKGLITVDADSIKFYESRATLAKVTMNAPENFTGDFDFTGEGQTWTKPQTSSSREAATRWIRPMPSRRDARLYLQRAAQPDHEPLDNAPPPLC